MFYHIKIQVTAMKNLYRISFFFSFLVCSLLFTTSNINAQVSQNIVEYKGSKVVANSVIVKVDETKFKLNDYFIFLIISTICDLIPLRGFNRKILTIGFKNLIIKKDKNSENNDKNNSSITSQIYYFGG